MASTRAALETDGTGGSPAAICAIGARRAITAAAAFGDCAVRKTIGSGAPGSQAAAGAACASSSTAPSSVRHDHIVVELDNEDTARLADEDEEGGVM